MLALLHLLLISYKPYSCTDTCYFPIELNHIACDKKEVKYYKKKNKKNNINNNEYIGFIRYIIQPYSDPIYLAKITKGVDWYKSQTSHMIYNLIKFDKVKFVKECYTMETFIKLDLLNNKITYVNDYCSYEKLKKEYNSFKKPESVEKYYSSW